MSLPLSPRAVRRLAALGLLCLVVALLFGALAAPAAAQGPDPYGRDTDYRPLMSSGDNEWLNPRNAIWILAQLHLLFGAFVLAVPMFVVIIEFIGHRSKDREQGARYDALAHEFTRFMAIAFSFTAIVGAVFTMCCLYFYPKIWGYMVEVFGQTMYLYTLLFFGEAGSLYLYYYGWGKISKWKHLGVGLMLNVFGVTLMFIANAWTTFMMAPGGIGPDGAVVDRKAAFFNFLLHPINIHRLIANLCLGGAVAAAYAAFKFLATKDPVKRAHYDWVGYIGNFIAVLFLLPLPFAGYYLGFEIYAYNQQLGIYMMGGVLSWLFIMQAVLIGVLFLSANYYLWLGMDRIEGAERYRGWIKGLLAVITVGVLVWATPKSLILSSSEIEAMKGINHPILSIFGVMSAKNTAVNLIILTTFLSFILYRRGNKVPTVSWAKMGKAIQALMFGAAAAVVIFIGIGGYVPALWAESTKRIAMSPWQVVAVVICMIVVMVVDLLMFRNAKIIGQIRWGQVSNRSQYALIVLAVTFTWTMALMGFVRSSLRQHWHVYEVMRDESAWAYTPALGPATVIVTITVLIFFLMISFIGWLANLGAHEAEDHLEEAVTVLPKRTFGLVPAWGTAFVILIAFVVAIFLAFGGRKDGDGDGDVAAAGDWPEQARLDREGARAQLMEYAKLEDVEGRYQVPIERAIDLVLADPTLLEPVAMVVSTEGLSAIERGDAVFNKLQPCATCHSIDGSPKIGPTMKGLFGSERKITGGPAVTADEAYLIESIQAPAAKVVEGFAPLMPPVPLSDEERDAVIEYIKSLK